MRGRSKLLERWKRFQPDWVQGLIILNLAFYALQLLASRHFGTIENPYDPTHESLFFLGDCLPSLVKTGEVFRLLSSTFLHASALHIAFNLFALYNIGPICQHVLGRHSFLSLYVLSGLAGSLASTAKKYLEVQWSAEASLSDLSIYVQPGSIGASGAIFGLIGFLVLVSRRVPGVGLDRSRLTLLVVINLAYGFVDDRIDNAGHIGGLLAGWFFGEFFVRHAKPGTENLLLGSGASLRAAALYGFTILFLAFNFFGPTGEERRELLSLRSQVLVGIEHEPAVRDLDDAIESVEDKATHFQHVDAEPLLGYLKLRRDHGGSAASRFSLPSRLQDRVEAWDAFARQYMMKLGPIGGLRLRTVD